MDSIFNWERHVDARVFYNVKTNVSSWTRPRSRWTASRADPLCALPVAAMVHILIKVALLALSITGFDTL
ncbi:hypothetical protein BASA81_002323 [Batrachochytrium salamandrivorans]|nr:hypothetical protein BASA81_002323 [Batrachochytrium salamandrivorans]